MIWLLKPAELSLKGDNRKFFEIALIKNLRAMLSGLNVQVVMKHGRFYINGKDEDRTVIENTLGRLFGISGWAEAVSFPKTLDAVITASVEEGKKIAEKGFSSFKVEARRADKSFPFDSYSLRCKCGDAILKELPALKVDVHKPDCVIRIEIREKAYIYSDAHKGLGGLPVGTAGRGLLLLSGGIDSPVAGFLMASRGMVINAVHFHTYPYTSDEAKQKTIRLAKILANYCIEINLHIISFTKIQNRLKEAPKSNAPWLTVLLRMAMMDCAEKIAGKINCNALITGDSLSQVASQTIENISCTQSLVKLPVLRPLIGMDKDSIIKKAQQIGTYQTSIEPYPDCCVLFTPVRPILRGDPLKAVQLYTSLKLEELINEALHEYEISNLKFQ